MDSIDGMLIHSVVESPPEYKEGLEGFLRDISEKVKPKHRLVGCIRVVFSFVIDIEGNVRNMCYSDNVEITKEAIEEISNWAAGRSGGVNVPVRMYISMYVKFG
ncbi:hypothetical protein LVD17_06120 [Fulvivirga ulvae]|uniref:hypothetical protein n=1 Tax=Fulvivirga ulvae TaxID=2904245 RepID=UPI001F288298|nr:hypothetical protein [Fulvivirga ulvae]UII33396.1 hypothetical protein LVD17_06120 [Fulvivirga ulvae]